MPETMGTMPEAQEPAVEAPAVTPTPEAIPDSGVDLTAPVDTGVALDPAVETGEAAAGTAEMPVLETETPVPVAVEPAAPTAPEAPAPADPATDAAAAVQQNTGGLLDKIKGALGW